MKDLNKNSLTKIIYFISSVLIVVAMTISCGKCPKTATNEEISDIIEMSFKEQSQLLMINEIPDSLANLPFYKSLFSLQDSINAYPKKLQAMSPILDMKGSDIEKLQVYLSLGYKHTEINNLSISCLLQIQSISQELFAEFDKKKDSLVIANKLSVDELKMFTEMQEKNVSMANEVLLLQNDLNNEQENFNKFLEKKLSNLKQSDVPEIVQRCDCNVKSQTRWNSYKQLILYINQSTDIINKLYNILNS